MKVVIVVLFCFINFTSTAQLWTEFRSYVYECVDSFYMKNTFKHKEILGISIIVNHEGKLISYDIRFKDQPMELSKKEYKWLFKLLSQENYKKYETVFNSDEELKYLKELKYSIRYIPKTQREQTKW